MNIPIHQQKLVHKGKPLHEGTLEDCHIADGTKLHLISSSTTTPASSKPINSAFLCELQQLASKWLQNPQEREAFVNAFQKVRTNSSVHVDLCFFF